MTNSKNTKRALLASVLSVVLCVVMLVGSTFAWFTDSVTSGKNIIKSGNLDVTMSWADGTKDPAATSTVWKDASTSKIFDYDKWEPGYTAVRHIKISNEGSLALKYEMRIAATGEVGKLADVIDVYYIKGGQQIADRTGLNDADKIGTLSEVLANPAVSNGHISGKKGETVSSDVATIALKMQETAGNDYQGLSIGTDFSIQLVATQYTEEEDSFGDDYDEGAVFPIVTQDDFEKALEEAKPGDKIELSAGKFAMPSKNYSIPAGVSIIGEEGTEIALNSGNPTDTTTAGMLIAEDNVTLANVTVTGKSMGSKDYNSYIRITGNNVTLDNVTIDALSTVVSPIRIDGTDADNVITIKNSNLYSTSGRAVYLVDGANGTVNIENTEITGVYPISVNSGSSQELVLNVTNSKLHGWISYGDIKSASFTNTEFSKGNSRYEFIRPYVNTTFKDCTFAKGFKLGAGATGKTHTINNCTSDGVKLTAENVESQLLDMTGSDLTNLKGCTIVVDGKAMTPGASSAQ
jgi:predicted ribosomally synthesized peptide with SipW-like signal peptide